MVLPVKIIGFAAQDLLGATETVQVLGRTSQAVFLEAEGEVIWVSTADLRHGRALLSPSLPTWPEGLTLSVRGKMLVASDHKALQWEEAVVWSPPITPQPPADLEFRARHLARVFRPLLDQVHQTLGGTRLRRVLGAIRSGDAHAFFAAALDLVGVGPGLTPLGDDFLGGVLFALRASKQYQFSREWSKDELAGRTSSLSLCLLLDLNREHGPEPLHSFTTALFLGTLEEAEDRARRLLQLGNTTGSGLFCGALCAWLALC
ncbi:DUF2877 domain-containing protein [Candidatus Bipolaricaulota bacterium]|nr:DUF2877 domain-containing protein [Candidatus Bipolaricaulota bacterium]